MGTPIHATFFDEVFPGLLGGDFIMFRADALEPCMRATMLASECVEEYAWPKTNDPEMPLPKIYYFLKGHSPELAAKIEWYEA